MMKTADSNENLQRAANAAEADGTGTTTKATSNSMAEEAAGNGSDEQNENHLNIKYPTLSWRSNGLQRSRDNSGSVTNTSGDGNWRSGNTTSSNKEDYYEKQQQQVNSMSVYDVAPNQDSPYDQEKKFITRTFEKSATATMDIVNASVGGIGLLQVDKTMLRNRDSISGRNNQRQHHQQLSTNNDKSSSKVTPLLLFEDMRISKILRRLLTENSSTAAVELCKKLEKAVRSPENVPYICRSFEYLTESMLTVLKQCPVQCADQASTILGLIGYVNRADFPIYKNYITKTYQTSKGIQKYLMLALKTTFSCDAVNLSLIVYSDRVLMLLKDYLENADKAENFIAISETIAEFSKHYKRAFEKHFTDIVDIVVGWHLEIEQPQSLKLHCATVLQQFSQYFVQELDFTFGLLGQFLEDIASFGEKAELSIGSFIGAFNSILKSLANKNNFIAFSLGNAILQQALTIITKATKQSLAVTLCGETIINSNEFLCLIYAYNFEEVNNAEIEEVIKLQMQQFEQFNELQTASLLFLIFNMIRQLRTNTPISMVTLVLKTEDNPIAQLKMSQNYKNTKLLLKIYHEILMIKNVPLLQEAYRHIVKDINLCIAALECEPFDSIAFYTHAQSECILCFYFSALSALATQTSSIIGMYALNPSILEMLIVNCKAANMQLWARHSALHSALLQLISVHCQKNHNYRISSRLLKKPLFANLSLDDASSTSSPTSENFSLILKFLSEIYDEYYDNAEKLNLNILLNWTQTLFDECREHAEILEDNAHFSHICKSVCNAALQSPLESVSCLEVLLTYTFIDSKILLCLKEATIYHLTSTNPKIRKLYTILFAKLPLNISLDFTKCADVDHIRQRKLKVHELEQWYISTTYSAPLRDKYFKTFLEIISIPKTKENLLPESKFVIKPLEQVAQPIFSHCWTAQLRETAVTYQKTALNDIQLLSSWLQYEAARYCVRNKLRTTVGKPQETFLKIEAIIMQYARILAMKEGLNNDAVRLENIVVVQQCARQLLSFLESLEKQIYNAAEGTAFAIPAPEKPAKTFFRVNAPTCKEWFKRIRCAVDLIAIHSMEPEMVVRYSEVILKSLYTSEKYNELLMDHTIMSLVWALLRCGEADTLQGLYTWVKDKTGKRHLWIKYVAEQAAGHKEQAAEGYMYILNEQDAKMDAYIKEFLTDQLFDCLYYTNQWNKLCEVVKGGESLKRETIMLSCAQNQAQLVALQNLYYSYAHPQSQGEVQTALHELTDWTNIDETEKSTSSKENFSYYKLIQKIESSFIANIVTNDGVTLSLPIGLQEALHSGLQESFQRVNCNDTSSNISEHLTDFIILNHVAQKLHDSQFTEEVSTSDTFDCSQVVSQSTVRLKCLRWSRLFKQHLTNNSSLLPTNNYSMFLDVATSARREGNAVLCRTELERFFTLKGFKEPLSEISMNVQNQTLILDVNDDDLLRGFTELANYMYTNASNQMDAVNLASAYCFQMIEQISQKPQQQYPDTSSKMLLTLAEWLLQRGSAAATVVNTPQVQKLLAQLVDITVYHGDECNSEIPPADMACGKLIQSSILQNGNSGQAWCAFGNWCYRWGKKIVEAKAESTSNQKAGLTQRDLDAIKEIILKNESDDSVNVENALDGIVEVLNRHQVNANDGDEDIETSEISSTELIESQLRKILSLKSKPAQTITSIIKIWRQAHKSVYTFYEMAAEAYFKYLCIETDNTRAQKRSNGTEDSSLVTTTLRLLRLVVKHAFGLQEVLEDGLSNTPTRPWNVIIPQLFSRLNHHEPYVRKRVSELLCRVAEDKPHLIIFPAVVGAQQELKKLQPVDNKESPERESEEQKTPLSTCFNTLLATLSNQAPDTVKQVQLLVTELKRVTLLWDEYWIHSLAQLYAEYSTLFNTFEAEVKKSTELQWDALRAKHTILMRHVSADLRKIAAVTEREAETNYERNFQERYNHFVQNTISELEKPLNFTKPNESWIKIKQLYSIFQQRALRTSASTLKMYDISPILASMRNTAISMPGVETFDKQSIYIKAVDNTVYILPTKTKPKKLAFFGSDGRKYTYLFKGLEDLHLDERIMQFLSISNSMLARCSDTLNSSNCYKAHFYSVIPLGPQSGLISWVDNVTPLFAIYKKWQQREALVKQQQKERPNNAANNNQQISAQQYPSVPAAIRPSELFYSKLTPLLAEQNIKITDTRKHWPLATLRRVLEELTKETPSDLLAKELWCHAINAAEWRRSIRNYALSVAVMSVIGYVIGLGDRHLDNMLVKLSSGEIVHIDYNVCFEKGKTLRVPEKVPFRMTPNLEEALGITGIEGTFRLSCEHVLRTLRKERETLLTLLEAFVYDPLVDWAVNDDGTTTNTRLTSALVAATDIAALKLTSTVGGATDTLEDPHKRRRHDDAGLQRKCDTDITRSTISLRFNELKSFWMQYNDEAKAKLHEIVTQIKALQRNREDIQHVEQERDSLTKQLAMIRELETLGSAMGSHSLNTISQRYTAYKKAAEEFHRIKQSVSKYYSDLKQSVKVYFEDLLIANEPQSDIGQLRIQLYEHQQVVYTNEFDLVRALLEQSAQEPLYNKSDFARKEMDNTLYQQSCMAMECIESLTQYAKILHFYPRSRLLQNRLVKYKRWYGALLDEECDDSIILEELMQHVEYETNPNQIEKASALKYSAAMEKIWIEMNFELHKAANFLSEQQQQVAVAPLEVTINAIESFTALDPINNTHALQLAMLETISKTNESFVVFEETSLNKDDDNFILDQQIDYIDMLLTMYQTVFQDSAQQSYAAIQTLGGSLQSIYKLKTTCQITYPERIIHFFMLDNKKDLQKYLQLLCACNGSEENYVTIRRSINNDELLDLLEEIEDIFDECTARLKNLYTLVQDILKRLRDDCHVKKFVQSILYQDFDPSSEKYDTIAKIFQNAQSYAESLQTNNLNLFYDARLLNGPVTKYINCLQNNFVTGLTSLLAYTLHQSLQLELQVASSHYQNVDEVCLLNAKALCQNLFVSLQNNCRLKHLQIQVHDQTKLVEHYTLVATAHFWANEPYFRDSQLIYGHIVHKEKLLNNIQNECQSLSIWKLTMAKIQTEIEENVSAIVQRLKWAVGANQNLYALQDDFNNCVAQQNERYRFYLQLATQLVECGNVLLQFELLQECPNNTGAKESVTEADRAFKVAVTKWQDALNNLRHMGSIITPVEQSIVQLLDPEGKVDQCWINNISGLLDEMTFAAQRQLADYDRAAHKIQENIYEFGQMLQTLMDNQLRMDIRHLLKSIAKVDAFSNQASFEKNNAIISARIREFQHSHKQFYAQLNDLQMKIMSRDYAENMLKQLNEQITNILQAMGDNYMDFIDLVQSFIQNDFSSGSPARSIRSAAAESQSNYNMAMEKKAINQREQKRNAYAVSVWKRIRMKLEGRDPDPNRRCTVTEQIDFIIREARNPDNLAVLYEGWTPWV